MEGSVLESIDPPKYVLLMVQDSFLIHLDVGTQTTVILEAEEENKAELS